MSGLVTNSFWTKPRIRVWNSLYMMMKRTRSLKVTVRGFMLQVMEEFDMMTVHAAPRCPFVANNLYRQILRLLVVCKTLEIPLNKQFFREESIIQWFTRSAASLVQYGQNARPDPRRDVSTGCIIYCRTRLRKFPHSC